MRAGACWRSFRSMSCIASPASLAASRSNLKTSKKTARDWRWAIDARVTHRALALKTALAEAGALYLPERLHAVRIALKKLRYAREVVAEAAGLDMKAELRSLKRSQDILGRLHDMQVLLDRIRQLQASLTPADSVDVPPAGFADRRPRERMPPPARAFHAPEGGRRRRLRSRRRRRKSAPAAAARRADRHACAMRTSSI